MPRPQHRDPLRRTKRDRKRVQRIRTQAMGMERLETRTMLTDPYVAFNLVNQTDYYLVFTEGTAQNGRLGPSEGTTVAPGLNSPFSIFTTYSVDVRSDASDAGTSIGTASVSTVANSAGYNPADSSGLLTFTYDEEYSTNGAYDPGAPNYPPWYTNGFLVTLDVETWGWNNTSPYDLELTAVSGAGASPAVGTVIAAGASVSGFVGDTFEFDILPAGGSEILGHSVINVLNNGNDYLLDTNNLATFNYNADDSEASGYTVNWQDIAINLAPAVIPNDGWTGGMGNTSPAVTPGQSFWALDYGSETGRWTIEDGAAWQSNAPFDSGGGTNYGSRAFPASLDANYQASYGPGSGFDGLWQMDIKIGSTGSSDNSFVETFYLAEREDPRVGLQYYADGSADGGPAAGAARSTSWRPAVTPAAR